MLSVGWLHFQLEMWHFIVLGATAKVFEGKEEAHPSSGAIVGLSGITEVRESEALRLRGQKKHPVGRGPF